MWKVIIVMALLIVCCYCIESDGSLSEETRATKKKKTSAKLIGMILLFIFSKVAVFKAVSMYFLMTVFQKLFAGAGLLLKHYLMTKMEKPAPAPVYGPPQDYNTVGYSYGPPDHEPVRQPDKGYPAASLAVDWLLNKNIK